MSDIRKAIMARLGEFARPGAKAEMAASVRRGIDPKKGGQWINGTWDGGTWSAMVFSEPSEAYGIPEFPHISKLAINPKDKPGIGGVIVNYDRGWDIKPSTPELQKAYREIAQVATAEVNKAVKQGWYSRTGEKARMGMVEQNLYKLLKSWYALAEEGNPAFEAAEAMRIAKRALSLPDYRPTGSTVSSHKMANELLDAIRTNYSRPGAKAKMALDWSVLSGAKSLEVFIKDLMGAINVGNAREAIEVCDDISKKANDVKQRIRDTAKFSRPGAKAAFAKPQFRVRKLHNGYLAVDLNQGSGWERYDTTHEDSWDGLEDYERGYEKAYARGLRWSGGAWRIPSIQSSRPDAKSTNALSDACWQGYEAVGTKKQDGKTVPNCVPKATAAKPESQDIESEEVKAGLKLMEKADEKVSEKIRTLIKEGKPQDQAVAIALDMKRRGEL